LKSVAQQEQQEKEKQGDNDMESVPGPTTFLNEIKAGAKQKNNIIILLLLTRRFAWRLVQKLQGHVTHKKTTCSVDRERNKVSSAISTFVADGQVHVYKHVRYNVCASYL